MKLIDYSCDQINAMRENEPNVLISKHSTPIIYLDTCLLIEFSRYKNGCCDNSYQKDIAELYETLLSLMKSNGIICVLGNQMAEMGATQNREEARHFLHDFTNVVFLEPFEIEDMQLHYGYDAFVNSQKEIKLSSEEILEKPRHTRGVIVKISSDIIYTQEKAKKLRQDKEKLAGRLNDAKKSGMVSTDYEEQFKTELKADLAIHLHKLEHCYDSIEDFEQYIDHKGRICELVGVDLSNYDNDDYKKDYIKAVKYYGYFLLSKCHHKLPYIWIRSTLFTHLMQRQNNVTHSDHLDIKWASTYLPFVDYAVTDIKFSNLLNNSGLSKKYNTKVYNMKTIKDLLNELNAKQLCK